MKTFIFPVALFIFWTHSYSQTPNWIWARSAQSGGNSLAGGEGMNITTDVYENVFIAGWNRGTLTFGPFTLPGPSQTGSGASFIAKYDSNGNVKWAKGSIGNRVKETGACTDLYGNCYLTGYSFDTVSFGSVTLTNITSGVPDIFLVKYDSLGNVLWAKSAGGVGGSSFAYGVATDAIGNIYVTGTFNCPSLSFGTINLTKTGTNEYFLAKYDSAGNILWAKCSKATTGVTAYAVTTDNTNNVYITGGFGPTSVIIDSDTLYSMAGGDIFIAKFDSSGKIILAKRAGGINDEEAYNIVVDSLQNMYITGYYKSPTIYFDSYTLTNLGSSTTSDAFLVRYDAIGTVRWVQNIGGTGIERGYGLSIDKSGLYFTGGYSSPAITIDTYNLSRPPGSIDPMFISEFDVVNGHALFAMELTSGGDDQSAIAVGKSGCIYIGGDFVPDSLSSGMVVGKDTLHFVGGNGENVFLAKLCDSGFHENAPENYKDNELLLYPNPCHDVFNIKGIEAEISLYDVTSRLLLHQTINNSSSINTEKLAKGIYFVEVKNANGAIWNGKIIKE